MIYWIAYSHKYFLKRFLRFARNDKKISFNYKLCLLSSPTSSYQNPSESVWQVHCLLRWFSGSGSSGKSSTSWMLLSDNIFSRVISVSAWVFRSTVTIFAFLLQRCHDTALSFSWFFWWYSLLQQVSFVWFIFLSNKYVLNFHKNYRPGNPLIQTLWGWIYVRISRYISTGSRSYPHRAKDRGGSFFWCSWAIL